MVPNLRELRLARKMSQRELAELIGVTQQAVQQYEKDKIEPDIEGLKRLADVFEVTVDYLIDHDSAASEQGRSISEEEYILLESMRRMEDYDRQSIIRIIKSLSGQ